MAIESFLPLITGALGGATTVGVFKGPIQTLEDLWYINYGYKASDKAAELKEKQAINIQKLRDETLGEAAKIEPENIQEPKLNIVGPALEASRYYIDESELRNMFAKVIASSMDSSKNNIIHPSFVEIIKQMNTIDARLVKEFTDSSPVIQIIITGQMPESKHSGLRLFYEGPTLSAFKNFYYSNKFTNYNSNANSISNLLRLGLIEIVDAELSEPSTYKEVEEGYQLFINENDSIKNLHETNLDCPQKYAPYKFEMIKNYITLTHYGESFVNVCI